MKGFVRNPLNCSEVSTHETEQADQDQIDRDHVIQYAWNQQDQDSCDKGDQRRGGGMDRKHHGTTPWHDAVIAPRAR